MALFTATLDDAEACQVAPLVRQAAENAATDWQRRTIGQTAVARLPRVQWTGIAPMDTVPPSGGAEMPIGAQADDPFHDQPQDDGLADGPGGGLARLSVTSLQKQLCILVDNTKLRALVASLNAAGRYSDMRRLAELRDPSVDHSWVRRLDFCEGPVMTEKDYAIALQLRIGANIVADSYTCPECNSLVDCKLSHSTCCAKAERTKGHYAVVRAIFDRIVEIDSAAVLEHRGLVDAEPGARPGDIFTRAAVPNRDAAVDVTIVSQEARGAGSDCVAIAHRGKFHRYRAATDEWGSSGPCLQPLVWSCEGPAHPDVARVMAFAAKALAQRSGRQPQAILQRWRADVGVALAIRRARMALTCLPPMSTRGAWVVHGEAADERLAEGFDAYVAGAEVEQQGDDGDEP